MVAMFLFLEADRKNSFQAKKIKLRFIILVMSIEIFSIETLVLIVCKATWLKVTKQTQEIVR